MRTDSFIHSAIWFYLDFSAKDYENICQDCIPHHVWNRLIQTDLSHIFQCFNNTCNAFLQRQKLDILADVEVLHTFALLVTTLNQQQLHSGPSPKAHKQGVRVLLLLLWLSSSEGGKCHACLNTQTST